MTPTNEEIDALKAKAEEDQAREVRMFGAPMGQTNTILSLISTITQLRARAEAAELKGWNEAIEAALAHAETVCPENTDLHFSIRALKKAPSHE